MARACGKNGEECIFVIGGKTARKEATWKVQDRWVDNIKMGLYETGWSGID
jgi:hypothetical protein